MPGHDIVARGKSITEDALESILLYLVNLMSCQSIKDLLKKCNLLEVFTLLRIKIQECSAESTISNLFEGVTLLCRHLPTPSGYILRSILLICSTCLECRHHSLLLPIVSCLQYPVYFLQQCIEMRRRVDSNLLLLSQMVAAEVLRLTLCLSLLHRNMTSLPQDEEKNPTPSFISSLYGSLDTNTSILSPHQLIEAIQQLLELLQSTFQTLRAVGTNMSSCFFIPACIQSALPCEMHGSLMVAGGNNLKAALACKIASLRHVNGSFCFSVLICSI